jgi:pyruvate ferredoxin oxidoreductase beta subunit
MPDQPSNSDTGKARFGFSNVTDDELLHMGNLACSGCGMILGVRHALKALGENTIMVNVTSCSTVVLQKGVPKVAYVHSLFQNGAPVASGIDAGLKILGKRDDTNILVVAGDGSTIDIGLGAVSAMAERRHRIIYLCYDNESYMNTGGQRSGGTPFGSATTTSPVGSLIKGEDRPQEYVRDVAEILITQGCDYVAKTSIAYPLDIIKKFQAAKQVDGMSFISIHSPCTTGWGFDPSKTIEVARMAVKTGFTALFEHRNGVRTLQKVPAKKLPVVEYLRMQERFSHMLNDNEAISKIQTAVDKKLERLKRDC